MCFCVKLQDQEAIGIHSARSEARKKAGNTSRNSKYMLRRRSLREDHKGILTHKRETRLWGILAVKRVRQGTQLGDQVETELVWASNARIGPF